MRKFSLLAFIIPLIGVLAVAQEPTDPLAEYKWVSRPLVIFADSEFDPRFVRQMAVLAEDPGILEDRDVVILIDTDPAANGPLRHALRPRDFTLVLIDKEGRIVLRKPSPWTPRELSRSIDKLPIRQDELDQQFE